MSNDHPFIVQRLLLCDYASQDISGKLLALGIVSPQIFFANSPQFSIPFFCIATIMPLERQFTLLLEFSDPSSEVFFKVECQYQNPNIPTAFEQINYVFQLPQVKFRGFGTYTLAAMFANKPVQHWYMNVAQGSPSLPSAQVSYKTFGTTN